MDGVEEESEKEKEGKKQRIDLGGRRLSGFVHQYMYIRILNIFYTFFRNFYSFFSDTFHLCFSLRGKKKGSIIRDCIGGFLTYCIFFVLLRVQLIRN